MAGFSRAILHGGQHDHNCDSFSGCGGSGHRHFVYGWLTLTAQWGGVAGWAGLHMIGGVIGGIIGTTLVFALKKRKISEYSESPNQH
jgi:hypothetical protein